MHTYKTIYNPSRNAINLVEMGWQRGSHGWFLPNVYDQTEIDYRLAIEINAKFMAQTRHVWLERYGSTFCKNCGVVKRADDKNRPCKGKISIGFRNG